MTFVLSANYIAKAFAAYSLPNDGEEQDRLDFQHMILDIVLDGRLATAPIGSPAYVLDIGTGTGIWCLEFAEKYPNSFVFGTDLALIQPAPRTSNCAFILEDSETADWVFPAPFDYIHMRSVGPCFNNIRTVIAKSHQHMVPGGWIDLHDGYWVPRCDDNSLEGTALQRWFQLIVFSGQQQGRDMLKAKHYKSLLLDAGFIDVEEKIIQLPGSPWCQGAKLKKIGRYMGAAFMQIVDTYQKFLEFTGLPKAEIQALSVAVKKDLVDTRIHWFVDT